MNASKLKPLELEDLFSPKEMYGRKNPRDFDRGTFIRRLGLKRLYAPKHKEFVQTATVTLLELLSGCQWHNSGEVFAALRLLMPGISWEEFNAITCHTAKSGEIEMRNCSSPSWESELRLIQECALY